MTKLEEIARAIECVPLVDGNAVKIHMVLSTEGGLKLARAAVEAMREPSEAMTKYAEANDWYADGGPIAQADEHWRRMIDAILGCQRGGSSQCRNSPCIHPAIK